MDTSLVKKRRSIHENNKETSPQISKQNSKKSDNLLKQSQKLERENLVLWKKPIQTIYYFILAVLDLLQKYVLKLLKNTNLLLSITLLAATYYFADRIPLLSDNLDSIEKQVGVCSWWVFLGILSSVGLGTGLHTFLLYLGPFIAKVTLASYECQTTDLTEDIKCPGEPGTYPTMVITLFSIMNKVRLESFMWGAGTAIGELPPYFMARAARLAGLKEKKEENSQSEEVDSDDDFQQELQEALEEADTTTLLGKGKKFMHDLVNKVGFFGILLAASIPNPLFDLAGITCGHFLIDFWTFFGATLIGKAIVKMHIQMIFIIFLFSKDKVLWLISLLDRFPSLQQPFTEFMEKQKTKLYEGTVDEGQDSGLLKNGMELLVISMVGYFVISIVNSMAQERLKTEQKNRVRQ